MQNRWPEFRLSDLCEFRAGSVFPSEFQGKPTGDYPFIKVSDMNLSGNSIFVKEANNWVTKDAAQTLRAKPLPTGTTVFAKIGEALKQNRRRLLIRDTIVDNNMMGAVPRRERILPRYLYYSLHRFDFTEIAAGTALPYLTAKALSDLRLLLPSLSEQHTIAHILGTLDDKIELNHRMNQSIENMARVLFRSWFVDFDPVHARIEGRRPASIDDKSAALFPDSFEDSPLGEIPRGWKAVDLGEVVTVADYVANGSFASLKANVRYLHQPDYAILVRFVDYQNGWNGNYIYVDKQAFDFLRKSSLAPGDIVVSNVGANAGTVFRVPDLGQPMTLGPNAVVVKPGSERDSTYFFYYFLSPRGQQHIRSIISGSAQPKFNKTDFRRLTIPLPTPFEQQAFAHILSPIDEKVERNRQQSRTLAAIRDALLPKLLSGEIRVREAKKIVEETV